MMSAARIGRVAPSLSVHVPPSRRVTASAMASTSSCAIWALPSCATGTQTPPRFGKGRVTDALLFRTGVTEQAAIMDLLRDEPSLTPLCH